MANHQRRGLSGGSITVIALTAFILVAYAVIVPAMTGHNSITADLGKLAVAVDSSIVRIAATAQVNHTSVNTAAVSATPKAAASIALTPAPTATAVPKQRFTFSAAGSVCMNADSLKAMKTKDGYHLEWLFDDLEGSMKADLSMLTLENTVIADEKTNNRNMPSDLLSSIAQMGVNTICCGYEDILSAGLVGAADTKKSISDAGMTAFGVSTTEAEHNTAQLVNFSGIKIALLHYQDAISSTGKKKTTAAERSIALSPLDIETMRSEISAAKAAGAQVILVSLCWGKSGAEEPTEAQKEMAQSLADAGADLIIGTHTDTVQRVEILTGNRGDGKYHPVLCAYSLGNLLSSDREKRAALSGMILNASVEYDPESGCISFLSFSYQPTYSWRGKYEGATRYRVLRNDGGTFAEYVDSKQQTVMSACYQIIEKVMRSTMIPSIYQ